jgi:rhodanese-related sulfurtransferase
MPIVFPRAPSGAPEVEPAWLEEHLDEVDVLDLREWEELVAWGHLPGARWVPAGRLMEAAIHLDRTRPMVLVDRAGRRATMAARDLERAGFRHAATLTGGMIRWRESGRSVSRRGDVEAVFPVEDGPVLPLEGVLDAALLTHALTRPGAVRWTSLASLLVTGSESCVDGRDGHAVLGTPGGDAGELLLALGAIAALRPTPLTGADIRVALSRVLDHIGRFYMHTDRHALAHLAQVLRDDARFTEVPSDEALLAWLRRPPRDLEPALVQHLTEPANVGCGHLRLALSDAATYGLDDGLVQQVLTAIVQAWWRGEPVDVVGLEGEHEEQAILSVEVEGVLRPWTQVPMVAPRLGGRQVFVHHPQVTSWLREQLAGVLAADRALVPAGEEALRQEMQALGARQLEATLGRLAEGLPVFDVRFGEGGATVVRLRREPDLATGYRESSPSAGR